MDLSYTQNMGNIVTGLHLYGKDLANKLSRESSITLTVALLDNAPVDREITENKQIHIVNLHSPKNSKAYWREINALSDNFDAVFFPYQVFLGKLTPRKAKLYMTVHDLTPLREASVSRLNRYERLYKTGARQKMKYWVKRFVRLSHFWYIHRNRILKHNVKACTCIFTDSFYSKEDIIKTYSVPETRIVVAYPTSGKEHSTAISDLKYKDYYLLISAERYLKNAHMALFALDDLWSKGEETRNAIITGTLPCAIKKRLCHPEKVLSLGYVSEGDLEYLYRNAYCFIFPSLAEGFGLPPAEAMKYGTRTISSDAMSLKELYSKTILFDPYSKESIKDAIRRIPEIQAETMKQICIEITEEQNRSFVKILSALLQR